MFDRDNRKARADVASRRISEGRGDEGDSGVSGEEAGSSIRSRSSFGPKGSASQPGGHPEKQVPRCKESENEDPEHRQGNSINCPCGTDDVTYAAHAEEQVDG